MFYPKGLNKVCLFELTEKKRELDKRNMEIQVKVRGHLVK